MKHLIGCLKILIIFILFIAIIARFFWDHIYLYVRQNWVTLRQNPFFIPIAGLFRRSEDNRSFNEFTKDNFMGWFWNISKSIFSYLIKPIQFMLKIMTNIIKGFSNTLNTFRYQAKIIRKLFADIVQSTAEKMSNSYQAIKFYQAKLHDAIGRQKAIFQMIVFFLQAIAMTISSLVNGPMISLVYFFPIFGVALLILIAICIVCGLSIPFVSWVACPICAICFEASTPIHMNDKKTVKPINKLNIGDIILYGGEVLSIMKFSLKHKKCSMYNYNDIIVSGSHLVFEKGKKTRIENAENSKSLSSQPDYLYCCISQNHLMSSGNDIFSDYHETSDLFTNRFNICLINNALNYPHLNNNILVQKSRFEAKSKKIPIYQWGLCGNTLIVLDNGKSERLSQIQLNQKLYNSNNVYGIIKHSTKNIDIFKYRDTILSGNQLVYVDKEWQRVFNLKESVQLDITQKRKIPFIYSIATNNHTFQSENLVFRDYLEIEENHSVYNLIHNANIESLS